jgi:hypothetical protein
MRNCTLIAGANTAAFDILATVKSVARSSSESVFSRLEETMTSKFTDFLVELGKNPKLLANYKNDPNSVMDAAGLTPAEKTLLLSGDAKLILAAFYNDPANKNAMAAPHDQRYEGIPYITLVHP